MRKRGPNLFFKYFYFLFGPGLFYPLRVPGKVQNFFGCLVGPLTLLHQKMELLRHREPRELDTLVTFKFNPRVWPSNSSAIRVPCFPIWVSSEFNPRAMLSNLSSIREPLIFKYLTSWPPSREISCRFHPKSSVIKPAKYREIQGIRFSRFPASYKNLSTPGKGPWWS